MSMYNKIMKFNQIRRNILAGLAGGALTGVSALATRQARAATANAESMG